MSREFVFKKRDVKGKIEIPQVKFGNWVLQILYGRSLLERHKINVQQYIDKKIKDSRKNIRFYFTKNSSITKKPLETRMGGGKSPLEGYKYCFNPGVILIELHSIDFENVYSLSRYIKNKLPCKIRLVKLDE